MTALALKGGSGGGGAGGSANGSGGGGSRRRRSPVTPGRIALAGGIALVVFVIWTFLSAQIVTERKHEMKTTTVILPPPPPPPPPEVKPVEQPPQPTIAPPIEQPMDTPPPPDQAPSSDPAPGDNALSAREGAGPSNYGLAVGNGGGTRIGGKAGGGGNGFGAYGELTRREVAGMLQRGGRDISRGSYTIQLVVTVDPASGRITAVRVLRSSGEGRRDDAIVRLLTGQTLSQRPPAGLPVMRLELNSRSGA